tara:strand:- start:535 stop:675 length:141 start_codon:yes stop_codon:yes gene_type:complete
MLKNRIIMLKNKEIITGKTKKKNVKETEIILRKEKVILILVLLVWS